MDTKSTEANVEVEMIVTLNEESGYVPVEQEPTESYMDKL